jgi:predicted dehydrogenase
MLGIAIVGCGGIGTKRAMYLGPEGVLVCCADIDSRRAQEFAARHRTRAVHDWREILEMPEVDIVVVATTHDALSTISLAAISAGKHVLVEKPAARTAEELEPVLSAAMRSSVRVRVGFNHRYHRAVRKARELVDAGELGELMYVRGRYGHGGRLGYEKEWRADPAIAGGGELIDQGSHLIDLARLFLGDFTHQQSFVNTYFWDMPVEDNAFLLLRTPANKVAFLHASCTEWKNLFSMEIYGRRGKLEIAGLGGSYGVERLTWYRMLPEMGPPETTSWEYPMPDDSWATEMSEFYADIRSGRRPDAALQDAFACLQIVQTVYREAGRDHRA